jgi:aquaporin Z
MLRDWREAALDGVCLSLFMASACVFGVLVFHPESRLHNALGTDFGRRVTMGACMGATAITLIYSPIGKRSGAHMNPATTLTFWWLGKISGGQALLYAMAQFVGGVLGVVLSWLVLGKSLMHASVNFVVTVPGPVGTASAFLAELAISALLITVVLAMTAREQLAPYTGLAAGVLVWAFIAFESPISGMSMNPARSFGSAAVANTWTAYWVYFLAPVLGKLAAATMHRLAGRSKDGCAKYMHTAPCHFCRWRAEQAAAPARDAVGAPQPF